MKRQDDWTSEQREAFRRRAAELALSIQRRHEPHLFWSVVDDTVSPPKEPSSSDEPKPS